MITIFVCVGSMFFYPILLAIGVFLSFFSLVMLIPASIDYLIGDEGWYGFIYTAIITAILGSTLAFAAQGKNTKSSLNNRQALFLTVLIWGITPFLSALPFYLAGLGISYSDSFFEAMSALTTTGSTVFTNLDTMPSGILMWRSGLQWFGGIGVVVMAIIILPSLQVGGMQLFRTEFSESTEKALPRAAQFIAWISGIYFLLTTLCGTLYWLAGMSPFDAWNHAMTTVATGGFSTHDASIAFFDNVLIEMIAVFFMILGSLPFILYLQLVLGKECKIFNDDQVRWFFYILIFFSLLIAFLFWRSNFDTLISSLRTGLFSVTSVMTGTGYTTSNYSAWGPWATPIFLFLMMLGGCAGSTTCGIKIFRVLVLFKNANLQIKTLLQPNGVFVAYHNHRPLSASVRNSVMVFFFIFISLFVLLSIGLGATGLDFTSALSASMTSITNVGPALGPIVGPSTTFTSLTDTAKWMMSIGMLLGRLEFFTILVLFSPYFWKK